MASWKSQFFLGLLQINSIFRKKSSLERLHSARRRAFVHCWVCSLQNQTKMLYKGKFWLMKIHVQGSDVYFKTGQFSTHNSPWKRTRKWVWKRPGHGLCTRWFYLRRISISERWRETNFRTTRHLRMYRHEKGGVWPSQTVLSCKKINYTVTEGSSQLR